MSERTLKNIGKVTLDLTHYSGDDRYCDGEIEDTLLEIAKERAEVEFPKIIEEAANWPILYHLSPLRENIVEWLPIDKTMKVLEVGAGCGAITGALSRKAKTVTCCDLSLKRSQINAYRHMMCDNVTIHVGNFMDVEADLDKDYDFICLIGVFEYAKGYMDTQDPYGDFLKLLKKHIKVKGRIAIAIENKFGLKYWAGCKEDHLATYFSSIENYPDGGLVRTFTDKGLIEIAKRCGFKKYRMYYPYPDYKFMTNLYSDRRLPYKGECKDNLRNMDRDRIMLFNEKTAFDSIIDEGLFNLYSNSYMMILGPDPELDYVRYSNDRLAQYSICTEIITVDGEQKVKKRALSEAAKEHLARYYDSYQRLSKRYAGGKLNINSCALSDDGMELNIDYVEGITLEKLLDSCIERNDSEGFVSLFKEYLERVSFGETNADITDLDMIFSNILVDGDTWTVIDYEWTINGSKPASELGFRAIYCYVLEDNKRENSNMDLIISLLGLSDSKLQELREDEMIFQKSVTGDHKALGEIREAIGNKVYTISDIEKSNSDVLPCDRVQLYEDSGSGYSEAQSMFFDDTKFSCEIPFGRRSLRIDPCNKKCIVVVRDISWNYNSVSRKLLDFRTNGKKIGPDVYLFNTEDPQIHINLKKVAHERSNHLDVDLHVTILDDEIAGKI